MNFKVGQKVVCVNDTPKAFNTPGLLYRESSYGMSGLTKGEIYTIEQIGFCPRDKRHVVWLTEIRKQTDNPWYLEVYGRADGCFFAARFRPLIETDISIFQAILANPHKELETA